MVSRADAKQTLQKIVSLEELPTYEECLRFIEYCGSCSIIDIALLSQGFPGKLFNIWNVEFIEALALELSKIQKGQAIEIGAFDGKLSYHLRHRGTNIIATDDYSNEVIPETPLVERLNHLEALERYIPEIVLASWVPNISDDVLNFHSVNHFIEIYSRSGFSPLYVFGRDAQARRKFHQEEMTNIERYGITRGDCFPGGLGHMVVLHLSREVSLTSHSIETKTSLPSTLT